MPPELSSIMYFSARRPKILTASLGSTTAVVLVVVSEGCADENVLLETARIWTGLGPNAMAKAIKVESISNLMAKVM